MDVIMIHRCDLDEAIKLAALRGAELAVRMMPRNRPAQYSIQDAAQELGMHRNTVSAMLKFGTIKLNSCGKIPTSEIDRIISARTSF